MNYYSFPPIPTPPKRKAFISYYGGDRLEATEFVEQWAARAGVFIPKTIGLSGNENFIDSTDTGGVRTKPDTPRARGVGAVASNSGFL